MNNEYKKTHGNLSVPDAIQLLNDIENYLVNPTTRSDKSIEIFKKFVQKSDISNSDLNITNLENDTFEKLDILKNFDIGTIFSQELINLIKNQLITEDKFLVSTYKNVKDGVFNVSKCKDLISKMKSLITKINMLNGQLQNSINSLNHENLKKYTFKNELYECSDEKYSFAVNRKYNENLQKITDLTNKKKSLSELINQSIGQLENKLNDILREIDDLHKKYNSTSETFQQSIDENLKFVTSMKNISYIQDDKSIPLNIKESIKNLNETIFVPLKITSSKDSIDQIILNLLSLNPNKQTLEDIYENNIMNVRKRISDVHDRYTKFTKKPNVAISYVEKTKKLEKLNNPKYKINLNDIKIILTELGENKTLAIKETNDETKESFKMLVYYFLRPEVLNENYKIITELNESKFLLDTSKSVPINELDKTKKSIINDNEKYKTLLFEQKQLQEKIDLRKSGTLESEISKNEKEITQLNIYNDNLQKDKLKLMMSIEDSFKKYKTTFKFSVEIFKNLKTFFDILHDDFEISEDDFKTIKEDYKMMYGGDKKTLKEFVNVINSDHELTQEIHDILNEYCQISIMLKSNYTKLYGNLKTYCKLIFDTIMYNLFMYDTLTKIGNETITIKRFLNVDDLTQYKKKINDFQNKKYYSLLVKNSNNLINTVLLILTEHKCIDVSRTEYVIDFILCEAFCQK